MWKSTFMFIRVKLVLILPEMGGLHEHKETWFFISLYILQILFWLLITLCCIKEEFLNDEPNFWFDDLTC